MDSDISKITPEEWIKREEYFLELLKNPSIRNQIPLLNIEDVQNFKNSTLVRFQGMIQDMHSPELYLDKFDIVNEQSNEKHHGSSRYCDEVETKENEYIHFHSSSKHIAERQTYVVISVPGVNSWSQITKANENVKMCPSSGSCPKKRTLEESMETESGQHSTINEKCNKKINCNENVIAGNSSKIDNKSTNLIEHFKSCFPLPEETGQIFHLKVYKNQENLKLNDVCEFVGFLAVGPLTIGDPENEENEMEFQTLCPPSSLVPRIHCVSFEKNCHNNPLILNKDEMNLTEFNLVYKDLLLILTQLLLGDDLAAEYMIFHLISEIYMRPNYLPLGKFSLNISNIPKLDLDYVSELYKFIERFVPKSYYLPLTLDNLNELKFVPKKNNESNSLTSGILQLSNNTHLVLDETKLNPGKLNTAGINNVKTIIEAIKNQKVAYDFNYYPLEFDCDIPFLIFSEGKSMLSSDVHVVLEPDLFCANTIKEIFEAAEQFLKPDILDGIRRYLTLARLTQYELTDKVEELVTNEFVNMRQQGAVSADDLHSMLVLSRLVAISQGKPNLDEESWTKACRLEHQRKDRLNKKPCNVD
ncbi:unnamed protein product [Phaedon cochleariae]|uniref:Mini-chromosome maintenance complex-binding protein n=1 Tax=Phaedon cochleariae TaxID=80249 RepID=A0A9P0GV94_PHACE|nr:unnamed protein product [Phaedon cochleariae]